MRLVLELVTLVLMVGMVGAMMKVMEMTQADVYSIVLDLNTIDANSSKVLLIATDK